LDSFAVRHPEVRILERHLPLTTIHPYALRAAEAAECAGAVGSYGPMRDQLYRRPALIEAEEWGLLAKTAHLPDTGAFASCVRSGVYASQVALDIALAKKLGARATPTVVLDGYLFGRPPSIEELTLALERRGHIPTPVP
jgi:protein-disulfide isomerase